jgi:hypothetical protein
MNKRCCHNRQGKRYELLPDPDQLHEGNIPRLRLTGEIHGRSVSWQLSGGRSASTMFTGTIDSDSLIIGTYEVQRGTIPGDFTFTARRME